MMFAGNSAPPAFCPRHNGYPSSKLTRTKEGEAGTVRECHLQTLYFWGTCALLEYFHFPADFHFCAHFILENITVSTCYSEVLNPTDMNLDRRLENVRCMAEHNIHDKWWFLQPYHTAVTQHDSQNIRKRTRRSAFESVRLKPATLKQNWHS